MDHDVCCACGHDRETHTHYRAGSDCGLCGPVACPKFRSDAWWRAVGSAVRSALRPSA